MSDAPHTSAYQREDITEGKAGVPLSLTLNIVNVSNQCAPILTAMVYIWHRDKDGLPRPRVAGDLAARVLEHGDECCLRDVAVCRQRR
ncbi:MAG TPA: hypothetical protein VM692_02495 [Gammaproteobacteria bacterium]|nr:hypothetical protein [Gammaproteobacteria bacterium]